MTVSVYAGSLAGYYARARTDVDRAALVPRLSQWLDAMQSALRSHLNAPLLLEVEGEIPGQWRSMPAGSWDAVRILAAYTECSDLEWPEDVPRSLAEDPAWQRVSARDFERCHFPQVQIPDFWVAGDFAWTASQAMPDGDEWVLGSLEGLVDQMTTLNEKTLQHSAENLLSQLECVPEESCRDLLRLADHAVAAVLQSAVSARDSGGMLVVRPGAGVH